MSADRFHQIDHVQIVRQDRYRPTDEQMTDHAPEERGIADAGGEQKICRPFRREHAGTGEQVRISAHALKILPMRGQTAFRLTGRSRGHADGENAVAVVVASAISLRQRDPVAPAGIDLDRREPRHRCGNGFDKNPLHRKLRQEFGCRRFRCAVGNFHCRGAETQKSKRENKVIDRIGEIDCHAFAGANAVAGEVYRSLGHQARELAISDGLRTLVKRRRVWSHRSPMKYWIGNVLPARIHELWSGNACKRCDIRYGIWDGAIGRHFLCEFL